jgi:hypothetical protein
LRLWTPTIYYIFVPFSVKHENLHFIQENIHFSITNQHYSNATSAFQ